MEFQCPLHSEIEAQVLAAALEEQAIPHRIQSFEDRAYNGIFQTQKGWGRIFAPEAYRTTVFEILDDLRSGDLALPDEEGIEVPAKF